MYELTVEQLAGGGFTKTKKFSLYEIFKKGLYKPIYKMTSKLWFGKKKQGRKRPLDTPKRMIERREREGERERER